MERDVRIQSEVYKELKVAFVSIEQQIKARKEEKKLLKFRVDLYNKCLDEHLLEKGSKIVRQHLDEARDEIKALDKIIEDLTIEKDAYRIELSVYEELFVEKLTPVSTEDGIEYTEAE